MHPSANLTPPVSYLSGEQYSPGVCKWPLSAALLSRRNRRQLQAALSKRNINTTPNHGRLIGLRQILTAIWIPTRSQLVATHTSGSLHTLRRSFYQLESCSKADLSRHNGICAPQISDRQRVRRPPCRSGPIAAPERACAKASVCESVSHLAVSQRTWGDGDDWQAGGLNRLAARPRGEPSLRGIKSLAYAATELVSKVAVPVVSVRGRAADDHEETWVVRRRCLAFRYAEEFLVPRGAISRMSRSAPCETNSRPSRGSPWRFLGARSSHSTIPLIHTPRKSAQQSCSLMLGSAEELPKPERENASGKTDRWQAATNAEARRTACR